MEVTITPIRRRSLVRRAAPWVLSLGLFSGGAVGLFRYATAGKTAEKASGPAAAGVNRDRARALFGDDSSSRAAANPFAATSSAATDVEPTVGNRYGSGGRSTFTAADIAAAENAVVPASYTDRYTAAQAASPAGTDARSALESAPDVTRGQNADEVNPLRSPAASAVAAGTAALAAATNHADEAVNAFREPAPAAAEPPTASDAAGRYAANPYDQKFAETFAKSASPEASSPVSAMPEVEPRVVEDAEPASQPLAAASPVATSTRSLDLPAPTTSPAEVSGGYGERGAYSAATAGGNDYPSQTAATPYAAAPAPTSTDAAAYGQSLPVNTDPGLTPTPGIQTAEGTGRPGERGLEGAQSPTLAIQKLGPTEIQVGKKCTFAVRVKNVGQRTAHDVTIHDHVPQGTKLVGTAPRASVAGADVAWDLGTLSAGEERVVEMELIPTDEGELGSVASVTFASQASARARCTRPQLALRLASQPKAMIGDKHIVQVEVSNPGTGEATGVMLLENVPQAVTHDAGPSLEYEIGTLRAGESKTLELVLTAAQAGVVQNVMVARADANLEVQAACEFEILAPGLKVSVDGPQMRYLERPAKYTVRVENPGTAAAHDVQLVTHLDKGLKFVSANNLGEYDAATHSVYWSLAELPANERGAVEVVALPVEPGEHTIRTSSKAAQGLQDEAETRVRVEGLAALTVEVSDLEDLIEVGGKTTYEIRVVNQGSKAATNVQIAALFTPGLRVLNAEAETKHAIQADRVMFSPLAQLPPRGETTFRVTVQAVAAGDQRLRVQVGSDDLAQPIAEEESTRVYADQ